MLTDLAAAIDGNRTALDMVDAFNPRARKEYIERRPEARNEITRDRRLNQAIASTAAGKQRHWKYQK